MFQQTIDGEFLTNKLIKYNYYDIRLTTLYDWLSAIHSVKTVEKLINHGQTGSSQFLHTYVLKYITKIIFNKWWFNKQLIILLCLSLINLYLISIYWRLLFKFCSIYINNISIILFVCQTLPDLFISLLI